MDITKQTFKAVDRYFKILSATGHVSKNASDKLMALVFIEDLLTGEMSQYITNNDLNSISNALHCVSDGCMIGNIRLDYSSCHNMMTNFITSSNCIGETRG